MNRPLPKAPPPTPRTPGPRTPHRNRPRLPGLLPCFLRDTSPAEAGSSRARLRWLLGLACGLLTSLPARAQGSAFAYQGRLSNSNGPVTGVLDLSFALFGTASGGTPLGSGTVSQPLVPITNGLFATTLDFGDGAFDGGPRWLEIGVRTAGEASHAVLSPRQALLAVPYSQRATRATSADRANSASSIPASGIQGGLTWSQLPQGIVTNGAANLRLSGTFLGDGRGITNLDPRNLAPSGILSWSNGTVQLRPSTLPADPSPHSSPHSVVVADLDRDGIPEIVSAAAGGSSVWIHRRNPDGTFVKATTAEVGQGPEQVVVADMNGDGWPDIVTANGADGTVTLLANHGNGSFTPWLTLPVGRVPRGVAVLDLDGDGALDLAVANAADGDVSLFRNRGPGGFQPAGRVPTGVQPYAIAAADLLGNGRPALVTANFGDATLTVLTNDGSGVVSPAFKLPVGRRPFSVLAADIDGDGWTDLASADAEGGTITLHPQRAGVFGTPMTFKAGLAPVQLAVGDLDRDGRPDLVATDAHGGSVALLSHEAILSGGAPATHPAGSAPWGIAVADLDGDGVDDIVCTQAAGNSLLLLMNGTEGPRLQLQGNAATATVAQTVADGAVGARQLAPLAVTPDKLDDGGRALWTGLQQASATLGAPADPPFEAVGRVATGTAATSAMQCLVKGSPLGTVTGFSGHERLSEPFHYYVTVRTSSGLNPGDYLGMEIALQWGPDGKARPCRGIVTACTRAGSTEKALAYVLRIQPHVARLGLGRDFRVFQDMSAIQIAEAVLASEGQPATTARIAGTPAQRAFTVQAGESALDFLGRLLSDEGVFYRFDWGGTSPGLVLGDTAAAYEDPGLPTLGYGGDRPVPSLGKTDPVTTFQRASATVVGRTVVLNQDLKRPGAPLSGTATGPGGWGEQVDLHELDGVDAARLKVLAEVRQGRETSRQQQVEGTSLCPDLRAGTVFTLADATDAGLSGRYVVTEVHHAAFVRWTNAVAAWHYGNRFRALPASVAYRPPPGNPKPVAHPCTGVVTGPPGERHWVDNYGRIKVRFRWDRNGPTNQQSSGWVRVATPLANGVGSGTLFLPQVGDEVLVNFVGGDPDQPVVVGSLNNADRMPPVALPNRARESVLLAPESLVLGAGQSRITVDGANPTSVEIRAASTTVYGTFNNNSDRGAKERIVPVEPEAALAGVIGLPISEWSYKADPGTRHVGPMAQDFHAAFGVGTDARHIAPIDEGGVALAAIQGLNRKLEAENAALKDRVGRLEKALQRIVGDR